MIEVVIAPIGSSPLSWPPRLRRHWVGSWVRTRTELRNGCTLLPSGLLCKVEGFHRGANLVTEPCKCCGVSVFITKVSWDLLEYVGALPRASAEDPA
jgi:hypothetical protein